MHKDTKFCKLSFDISTFGFKAPPYCSHLVKEALTRLQAWSRHQEHSQVLIFPTSALYCCIYSSEVTLLEAEMLTHKPLLLVVD